MSHGELVASPLGGLRDDLVAEQGSLDEVVAGLSDDQWRRATPSPGWTVADQIAHLTYFDRSAATAILDPDRFGASVQELTNAAGSAGVDDFTLRESRRLAFDALLAAWRAGREELANASSALREDSRVAWYGPSMSATSFLGARLMETWAHGVDVVDTVGVTRAPTARLRHVARLGYLTRGWSYHVHGESVPDGAVRLELRGPSGEGWVWGDAHADDVVSGDAEEFCLVVTQRRHLGDTALASGELGRHWLSRAQAFAGAASSGPYARTS